MEIVRHTAYYEVLIVNLRPCFRILTSIFGMAILKVKFETDRIPIHTHCNSMALSHTPNTPMPVATYVPNPLRNLYVDVCI